MNAVTIGLLSFGIIVLLAVKAHGVGAARVLTLGTSVALPANFKLYSGVVSPEMTTWAESIVAMPQKYPFGALILRDFGKLKLAARVEHHTWTMRDGVKTLGEFRGVTLYQVT